MGKFIALAVVFAFLWGVCYLARNDPARKTYLEQRNAARLAARDSARHDSILIANEARRVDSVHRADSMRVADSLRRADSVRTKARAPRATASPP